MKRVDARVLAEMAAQADASPRRRSHFNLHPQLSDPIQRLCLVMNRGSYVRPHRHVDPDRWELFTVLKGSAVALCFDAQGCVTERVLLGPGQEASVVEIEPGAWHTLTALEDHTLLLENKPGPYIQVIDKDFAEWAPAEGEPGVEAMAAWFMACAEGDVPPASSA